MIKGFSFGTSKHIDPSERVANDVSLMQLFSIANIKRALNYKNIALGKQTQGKLSNKT